nr:hypothetical protein [Tanacetum cinerariifolium]
MVRDSVQLETAVNTIFHEYLLEFTSEYGISKMLHPELPGPENRIVDFPEGKGIIRYTYPSWWISFSKRPGKNTPQCYTKPLDSLKNWNTASSRYYLGDEVYPTFHYDDDREIDLFNLIRAPNPTKVKTGSRPLAPHELPLLTLTAPRVIEMDEPAAATDSSGVRSAIERTPDESVAAAGSSISITRGSVNVKSGSSLGARGRLPLLSWYPRVLFSAVQLTLLIPLPLLLTP